ncbi:putative Sel1-like repeat-containing protein [Cotonvirus japonicus]|uniref:Sel1-like repeat-containing protein n=1 Tax=Cotonvirus japonicus TaxID=2811091 RepID=A0ABM7NRF7_9VIRU|nr:putative Sel1-like repeat-containing protein [Cotonvirus japonicus]BCS82745.1 putative Sel1-like repeat-containing protein [Cotonvirus japonicus]
MNSDQITIKKLINSASLGDQQAQNEIAEISVNRFISRKEWSKNNPFEWENIFEKCCTNPKYCYMILEYFKLHSGVIYGANKFFKNLYPFIKKLAKSGDALSQSNLGYMCYEGVGTVKNHKEAKKWFVLSSNQNSKNGQCNLGSYYSPRRDYEKSFKLLKKSADQDFGYAQNMLGEYYSSGKYVNIDLNEAFKWFKLSIKKNIVISMQNLAYVYNKQDFEKYDHQKYIKWTTKSAILGDTHSRHILLEYYENNENISEMIYWYKKTSNSTKLKKYMQYNKNIDTNDNNNDIEHLDLIRENLENTKSEILCDCQLLIVQNKYYWNNENAVTRIKSCELLENVVLKFIDWTTKLQNGSNILLSCLNFIDDDIDSNIRKLQYSTGILPNVKQYELRGKKYISFKQKNISFIDDIMNFSIGIYVYEWSDVLHDLKHNYENLLRSTDAKESIKKIHETINLIESFDTKIKNYYELILDEIEHGAYIRNSSFRDKNHSMFE